MSKRDETGDEDPETIQKTIQEVAKKVALIPLRLKDKRSKENSKRSHDERRSCGKKYQSR